MTHHLLQADNAQPVSEQCPPLSKLLLLVFYCWALHYMAQNSSLVSSAQLFWLRPSQLLVYPQPTQWGDRGGRRESLNVEQELLSNSKNIGVLSTLFQSQIQSTPLYRLLWRKLTLFQADPNQSGILLQTLPRAGCCWMYCFCWTGKCSSKLPLSMGLMWLACFCHHPIAPHHTQFCTQSCFREVSGEIVPLKTELGVSFGQVLVQRGTRNNQECGGKERKTVQLKCL